MDAPPPLNPPRIYTLADLDLDCLALVLSLVQDKHVRDRYEHVRDRSGRHDPIVLVKDCRARFRAPPLACKALAAAAARPSVAWDNLAFRGDGNRPAGFASFLSALHRVATSVRRLHLYYDTTSTPTCRDFIAALLPALETVAPYLQCLDVFFPRDSYRMLSVVPGPMHSATRLVELHLGNAVITGPPGMLAAAFPAIAAHVSDRSLRWRLYAGEHSLAIPLNRDIVAASAAAGRPVRLIKCGYVHVGPPGEDYDDPDEIAEVAPDVVDLDLEALGAEGLKALILLCHVERVGGQQAAQAAADAVMARVATLVARLLALRDLTVNVTSGSWPVVFDFRAVHALSRLAFVSDNSSVATEVCLSRTLAASLQVLALSDHFGFPARPPGCVRNAGDALTRLTHLDYGVLTMCWEIPPWQWHEGESPDPTTNLSAWGNAAEYRLPTLRCLTAFFCLPPPGRRGRGTLRSLRAPRVRARVCRGEGC